MIRIPLYRKDRNDNRNVGNIIGNILANDEFRIYLVSDSVITGEIAGLTIQLHGNVDLGGLKITKIRELPGSKAIWILEKNNKPIQMTPDALKVLLLLSHTEEAGVMLQDIYKYVLILLLGGLLWRK